jgi:beta-lactamase superfamily II metal-dependent hydrolase
VNKKSFFGESKNIIFILMKIITAPSNLRRRFLSNLKFEGVFHNVGQGLFYSGEIWRDNSKNIDSKNFAFVYDCGSVWHNGKTNLKYLKPAIKRYSNNLVSKRILHLLTISHLHADHINGIPHLLEEFERVKWVVIPYLTPFERLLVAIANINAPIWYFEFLSEPAEFLLKRNVERVVYIHPAGDNIPLEEKVYKNEEDSFVFPIDKELKDYQNGNGKNHLSPFNDRIYHKYSGTVKLYDSYCQINSAIWEFIFFNYKKNIDKSLEVEFNKCIKGLTIYYNDFKKIITNQSLLKKIRENCYKQLIKKGGLKDENNTSLILFHRPLTYISRKSIHYEFIQLANACNSISNKISLWETDNKLKDLCKKIKNFLTIKGYGTLLLGDINLNLKDFLRNLKNFLTEERLKSAGFILIPHHGSKENWNIEILNYIGKPSIWIASAGTYNTYGHPSFKIFRDLEQANNIPVWCSEHSNPFIYWMETECN